MEQLTDIKGGNSRDGQHNSVFTGHRLVVDELVQHAEDTCI